MFSYKVGLIASNVTLPTPESNLLVEILYSLI